MRDFRERVTSPKRHWRVKGLINASKNTIHHPRIFVNLQGQRIYEFHFARKWKKVAKERNKKSRISAKVEFFI